MTLICKSFWRARGTIIVRSSGTSILDQQSVSGTGHQIATETINGGPVHAAALATQTGWARNVLFSSEGVMADANMLQEAISYAANGTGPSVGLHLPRDSGIVAARVDMDQSQELEDVNPAGSTSGI